MENTTATKMPPDAAGIRPVTPEGLACYEVIVNGHIGVKSEPPQPPSPYAFRFDERKKRWCPRFPGDEPCEFDDCEGLSSTADC